MDGAVKDRPLQIGVGFRRQVEILYRQREGVFSIGDLILQVSVTVRTPIKVHIIKLNQAVF